MTTPADPMPIDEALAIVKRVAAAGRAIQRDTDQIMAAPNNIADHNANDIPSPGQVVEAVEVSFDQSVRVDESLEKLAQMIGEADCLIRQASSILGDVWGIMQDLKQ